MHTCTHTHTHTYMHTHMHRRHSCAKGHSCGAELCPVEQSMETSFPQVPMHLTAPAGFGEPGDRQGLAAETAVFPGPGWAGRVGDSSALRLSSLQTEGRGLTMQAGKWRSTLSASPVNSLGVTGSFHELSRGAPFPALPPQPAVRCF